MWDNQIDMAYAYVESIIENLSIPDWAKTEEEKVEQDFEGFVIIDKQNENSENKAINEILNPQFMHEKQLWIIISILRIKLML